MIYNRWVLSEMWDKNAGWPGARVVSLIKNDGSRTIRNRTLHPEPRCFVNFVDLSEQDNGGSWHGAVQEEGNFAVPSAVLTWEVFYSLIDRIVIVMERLFLFLKSSPYIFFRQLFKEFTLFEYLFQMNSTSFRMLFYIAMLEFFLAKFFPKTLRNLWKSSRINISLKGDEIFKLKENSILISTNYLNKIVFVLN